MTPVDDLYSSAIDSHSMWYDWSEHYEDFRYYEAHPNDDYEEGKLEAIEARIEELEQKEERTEEEEDELLDLEFEREEVEANNLEAWVFPFDEDKYSHLYEYCDGPMMNYYYPLPCSYRTEEEIRGAAIALLHLPLCLVEFEEDDEWVLALTGGGMDLSREIGLAFMRLGYLPPAWLRIPNMAGFGSREEDHWLLEGMMRTYEIQKQWAESNISSLKNTMELARAEKTA